MAIGVSERTSAQAIEKLARRIFENPQATFKKVVAIEIPTSRTFMHLDTVFTSSYSIINIFILPSAFKMAECIVNLS
nr:arginine deiminase family protein [Staphylococcus aureus]